MERGYIKIEMEGTYQLEGKMEREREGYWIQQREGGSIV